MSDPNNPVGHTIAGVEIVGRETDGFSQWIGSDLLLDVPPLGAFALRVVTKGAFLDEHLAGSLMAFEDMEVTDFDDTEGSSRPPYVLNDELLTEDILRERFVGREIRPDLAASLWQVINHDSSEE